MSLASQISALATAIGEAIRDTVKPKLVPSAGTTGQVLAKASNTNHDLAWTSLGTAAALNISVGTTAPSSPTTGQIWIDTN